MRLRAATPRTLVTLAVAVTVLAAGARRGAEADEPASNGEETAAAPVYHVSLAVDGAVIAAAALAAGVPYLFRNQIVTPSCPCSRSSVNALDRLTVGWNSHAAAHVSDGLVIGQALGTLAFDALDVRASGGEARDFGNDAIVLGEAVLVGTALTTAAKFSVQRPMPVVVAGQAGNVNSGSGYLSFWSGHVLISTTLAVGLAETYGLRHPKSRIDRWLLLGGLGIATTVSVLRLASGQHYITDVLTAAAVGGGVGFAVPYLHRRAPHVALVPTPGGALLSVSLGR